MSTIKIPFSEPPWLMGWDSPYYTESHRKWQKTCRNFIENTMADAGEWEKAGSVPGKSFQDGLFQLF
jgi:acyl-CoA dehydrogenase